MFEADGGDLAAREIFSQATRGGTRINKAGYRGEEAFMVGGRFIGRGYNRKGVPTIDYGPVPGADPFKIHFRGG